MSLQGIEAQPDFPTIDVLDDNAAMLELMLQNGEILEGEHTKAEEASPLYRFTHDALRSEGSQFDDAQTYAAFSHGMRLYEAISSSLDHEAYIQFPYTLAWSTSAFRKIFTEKRTVAFFVDARDDLAAKQPVTDSLIKVVGARRYARRLDVVSMGAGIGRQIEIEATQFDKDFRDYLSDRGLSPNPGSDTIL